MANQLMDLLDAYKLATKRREDAFGSGIPYGIDVLGNADAARSKSALDLADYLARRYKALDAIFVRASLHEDGHRKLADLWEQAEDSGSDGDYQYYASQAEQLSAELDNRGAHLYAELLQALVDDE